VAEPLVAEIGTDMAHGPTAGPLASWAGLCPGNHESAGTPLSAHTRQGNGSVRGPLPQAAWAATRTKRTDLAAQFRRLTTRLGTRRAWVAVGHSMLMMAWHVLSNRASDQEWGRASCERCDAQAYRLTRLRTRERLGLTVTVEPTTSGSEASSFS
jgi:transposase